MLSKAEDRSARLRLSVLRACADTSSGSMYKLEQLIRKRDASTDVDTSEMMLVGDQGLPERLAQLYQPPCDSLWVRGDRNLLSSQRVRVAIVGARRAQPASLATAEKIAFELAQHEIVIVSGLAMGVDAIAHEAALSADGHTIAVLGSGLSNIHPRRNVRLADAVTKRGGLLVSEYGPTHQAAYPYRFRQRNRIIAAISDYVIIVQATAKSGSMVTAAEALDLGVSIGAVPSALGDAAFLGSSRLIRDGADCVLDAQMVLRQLAHHNIAVVATRKQPVSRVPDPLDQLLTVPRSVDELIDLSGLSSRAIRRLIGKLELDGIVERTDEGLIRETVM